MNDELVKTMNEAASFKNAAAVMGILPDKLASYIRTSDDDAIKESYRLCIARGKRSRFAKVNASR